MEVRTKVNLLCSHRAGENLIKAKKRIENSHAVTFYHSEHREYSLKVIIFLIDSINLSMAGLALYFLSVGVRRMKNFNCVVRRII
jgi:hypothetical protein